MIYITDVSQLGGWKQIQTAPLDRDLELAVIDTTGTHLVAFPCRRLADDRWVDVETRKQVCFTTSARRIGEIGCLTSPARRYVEPNMFQTHSRICYRARCDELYRA